MKAKDIQRIGRFWLATAQRADGQWVAWAQTTPIYSDAPIDESREQVWRTSGFTREQAAAKLKQQLALPPFDAASVQERHNCWVTLLAATGMVLGGVLAAEPMFVLGGIVGVVHGIYACVGLSEDADNPRA
jgi:hypothetical protein